MNRDGPRAIVKAVLALSCDYLFRHGPRLHLVKLSWSVLSTRLDRDGRGVSSGPSSAEQVNLS